MGEQTPYLITEEKNTGDGCFLKSFNCVYDFFMSILYPQHQLKKVNKQLSVFFEDNPNGSSPNRVSVEGFLGRFNENQLMSLLFLCKRIFSIFEKQMKQSWIINCLEELLNFTFGEESTYCGKSFYQILKEKGFNDLRIVFDTDDFYIHRCHVYNEVADMQHLLIQIFIRCDHTLSVWSSRTFNGSTFKEQLLKGNDFIKNYFKHPNLNVTFVEWLRMQDYTQRCENKILLPSQLHSGLGLTREVHFCVQYFSAKLKRDGISNTPEQWHNALQYLRLSPPYKFLNPAYEGIFLSINEAVKEDIKEKGFAEVVWAVASKCLKRKDNGERFEWLKFEQISPMSDELKTYFNSVGYQDIVNENYHPENLYIDWDLFYPKHLN